MLKGGAVVVLSGGQDSTTCLFWALRNFEGPVHAVTFDYGQRHATEIAQAQKIAKDLNVPHHLLDMGLLNQLSPSALTRSDIEVAEGKDGGLPSTFVPGRNMVFLTFAAILARQLDINHIVTGVCETDFSGYPDCRDNFIKSLSVSLSLSMDCPFVIHAPLMWMDKRETWALADRLGVVEYIRLNTVTCYNGIIGDGCGKCPACGIRRKGLVRFYAGEGQLFQETILPGKGERL